MKAMIKIVLATTIFLIFFPNQLFAHKDNLVEILIERATRREKNDGRNPAWSIETGIVKYGDPVHEILTKETLKSYIEKYNLESTSFQIGKDATENIDETMLNLYLTFGAYFNDDPNRKLWAPDDEAPSTILFSWCINYIFSCQNETNLICRGHKLDLQFLHSMASDNCIEARVIKTAIFEWIRFCYLIANGTIPGDCVLADLSKYIESPDFILSKLNGFDQNNFTVFKLFFDPKNEHNMEFSPELEQELRSTAMGSALHIIQDSYCTSHVQRGNDAKIETFLSYKNQDHDLHRDADMFPSGVDEDDPIKIQNWINEYAAEPVKHGAEMLNYIINDKTWQDMESYLNENVFELIDENALSGPANFSKTPFEITSECSPGISSPCNVRVIN